MRNPFRTWTDLATLHRIGVGAPGVPLGQYTAAALAEAGTRMPPTACALGTARATLAHAYSGVVDAAVVY